MTTIEIIRIIEEIIMTIAFTIVGIYAILECLKMNREVKKAIIEEKKEW